MSCRSSVLLLPRLLLILHLRLLETAVTILAVHLSSVQYLSGAFGFASLMFIGTGFWSLRNQVLQHFLQMCGMSLDVSQYRNPLIDFYTKKVPEGKVFNLFIPVSGLL